MDVLQLQKKSPPACLSIAPPAACPSGLSFSLVLLLDKQKTLHNPARPWEDTALGPTETEHGAVLCRPQKVPLHLPVQLFQPKSHLQIACGSNLYLLTA